MMKALIFGLVLMASLGCAPKKIRYGVVCNKSYSPSTSSTTTMMIGDMLMPMTTYVPESFDVEYRVIYADSTQGVISNSVSLSDYNRLNIGDTVMFQ